MPTVAILGTRGYPSYYGGFETAVRKLAPFLADAGWDVTVYGRPGATRLESDATDKRVRTVQTWGVETKSFSTLSYGLSSAIHSARERPDVALIMNCANGYWIPILKRAGIPTLVNVDGIEWDRAKWGRLAKWVFRTGAKWTAKHGTELVFDAEEIGKRWAADFSRSGTYIPYGGERRAENLPLENGLSHRKYVLMVARFVPENTIAEFFDAAAAIAQHTDVVIVGSSGYGGELDNRARELDEQHPRIKWLGHVSDDQRLFSLWQHAGVYFHGHSVGGTNPALVQAMAMGAPVVARDTPYNREVLLDGGVFVAARAEAIASAILQVARDPGLQRELSALSLARASAAFTWEGVCGSYETALRKLADSSEDARTDQGSTRR